MAAAKRNQPDPEKLARAALQSLVTSLSFWRWVLAGVLSGILAVLLWSGKTLYNNDKQLAVLAPLPQQVDSLSGRVDEVTKSTSRIEGAFDGVNREISRLAQDSKMVADQFATLKDVPKQLEDVKTVAERAEAQGKETARLVSEQTKEIEALRTTAADTLAALERIKNESVAAIQKLDRPKEMLVRVRLPLRDMGRAVAPEGTTEFVFDIAELAKGTPIEAELVLGVESVKLSGPREAIEKLEELAQVVSAEFTDDRELRVLVWTSSPGDFAKIKDQLFADLDLSKR